MSIPPRRLVVFDSVGCVPPRVMLAPAGARLPPGVRPVVALAIVEDSRRGGSHAGFTTLTPGVAAHAVVAPTRRLRTECHGVAHAASAFTDVATSRGAGLRPGAAGFTILTPGVDAHGPCLGVVRAVVAPNRRLRTECHGVAHAASAFTDVATNRGAGHRLATHCHGVADAMGHGRTAGALGLGMSFAPSPNRHAASAFTISDSGSTGLRRVAVRALDLGEDGEGEEDLSDEYRYQDAHRQIQEVKHLICLKNRVKIAVHLGLVPSGQMARSMLDAIGHVDPAAPVYHWVIHRCHASLNENLGDKLYKDVIIVMPKDGTFNWIVDCGNDLYLGITELMAEIKYSVLHTESWRAAVRDHKAYDYAPAVLSELGGVLAEICTNIDMACFMRPDPWVIQRMVENHALALLHLEESLLDFDEVLASGEPMDDARTARELRMHYGLLFAQDITPLDYMAGIGKTDTRDVLVFLGALKSMIRSLRRQWN